MSSIGHLCSDRTGLRRRAVGPRRRFDPPWRATEEVTPDERRFDQGELTPASNPSKSFVETSYHVRVEPGQTLEVTSSVLGRGGHGNPRHALVVTGPLFVISNNPRTRGQFASVCNDTDRPRIYSFRIMLVDWRDATDAVYGISWSVEAPAASWTTAARARGSMCLPAARACE